MRRSVPWGAASGRKRTSKLFAEMQICASEILGPMWTGCTVGHLPVLMQNLLTRHSDFYTFHSQSSWLEKKIELLWINWGQTISMAEVSGSFSLRFMKKGGSPWSCVYESSDFLQEKPFGNSIPSVFSLFLIHSSEQFPKRCHRIWKICARRSRSSRCIFRSSLGLYKRWLAERLRLEQNAENHCLTLRETMKTRPFALREPCQHPKF